jgi:hypothetical protein
MKPNQQTDSVLIDLLLKRVDLFIFCKNVVANVGPS